ncbi:hypothetical protein GCM10020367_23440 [Streptomyces sannanensis]|uniref:ABC transporter permease n=1 Tax=Streptomyces sannanensis TaxID=285536 RepID=A0ABP6SAJ3_9ACTN
MSGARRSATAQLLAVGRRTAAGRQDPRALVQSLCLILAATAAALLLWGTLANHAVYQGRDSRSAARMPVAAASEAGAAAWWTDGSDSHGDRTFSVIRISPATPAAPLPPGLPRWPEPGESFVSPALLEEMPSAATRYGRQAGTISPEGLADPGELFVYLRPPIGAETRAAGAGSFGVTGYGVPHVNAEFFTSQGSARPETDLYWLMGPLLGLPVAVLLVVASRLGARRRDRRLAVLHAIGAGPSVRARIAAGECLGPLALGTVLAGVPLTVLALTGVRLPVTGYEIAAGDLAPLRIWFPLGLVALWAALCSLFAALHLRSRGGSGNRPRPAGDRPPSWPGYLCAAGAVSALWGAMIGGAVGVRIFMAATVLALAGLPPVLGRAAAGLAARLTGRGTADGGKRSGDAARLIGGRWAAAHPGVIARASAALAVLLGLLAQMQVTVTDLTTEARAATVLAEKLDGRMVRVSSAPADPAAAERFLAALAPGDRVLRITESDSGPPVLGGTCEDLAALGPLTTCPRTTTVSAEHLYTARTPRTEALRWTAGGTMGVRAAAAGPGLMRGAEQLVVLTAGPGGRDRVAGAAYASLRQSSVSVPGEEYAAGSKARARIADWVVLVALAGFVLLALTGAVGLLHAFLDRAEELRPLAGYTSGARFHLRIAWWGMGVPMGFALMLATGFAAVLAGVNLGFLARSGDSPLGLLGAGLALSAVLCAAATAAGGLLSSRFTHRWVPSGD